MKNYLTLSLLAILSFPFFGLAQQYDARQFQWWDYRSAAWLNGRIGVGYQLGNHNRHLYFFTETDVCASCLVIHYVHPPADLREQIRINQHRFNLHIKLQTTKDFRLYNTVFSRRNSQLQFKNLSWTYLTNVGASIDFGLYRPGRLTDMETGGLNDRFRMRSKLRLRYDVLSRYHSYYYRKLSNTIGYFTLNVSSLDDRWGINLNWGNDAFIVGGLRNFLLSHDHGETNSAHISGYWRPLERKSRDANETFDYLPESLQKLEMSVALRMVTDRRTHKRSSSNQARVGTYDVLGLENSFHGYYGIQAKVESGFYNLRLQMGKDDLKWGRDMQRFAHQGYRHLPAKWARGIWGNFVNGTSSPLFPWESQTLYHKKPKFYYELDGQLMYPYFRWF